MRQSTVTSLVAASGAAIMALEVLGARVLAPVYGTTLFPWSVLITVSLAALALGYRSGGRLADRGTPTGRLLVPPACAGAWLCLLPLIDRPILNLTVGLDQRWGALIGAAVLFFPPLFLLGMIAPWAIRLRARTLEEVGRATGDLLATAALAGVAGALLTGLLLVPWLGVHRTTFLVGLALLAAAALAWLADRRSRAQGGLLLLILLPGAAALWKPLAERPDYAAGLTAIRHSAYGELRVEETEEMRSLLVDGVVRGKVQPGTWLSTTASAVTIDMVRNILKKPGRALVLGLGPGSVATSFARDRWKVDAVEPDPAVVEMARRYFGFGKPEVRVFVDDPRRFLSTHADRYELIVLDGRGSCAPQFHLWTRETFQLLVSRLNPAGMLALNVRAVGWEDPLVRSVAAMLRLDFREVMALPTAEPPDVVGDVVLLAADRPIDFPAEELGHPYDFLPDRYMHWAVVQRNHAWDNRYSPGAGGARILTDDKSPADLWADRINRATRREQRENPLGMDLGWW